MRRSTVFPFLKTSVKESKFLLRQGFLSLSLTSLLLLATLSWANASHPMEALCDDGDTAHELEFWVQNEHVPQIIIADVLEVSPTISGKPLGAYCWAKVHVQEWIKGAGPDELWVVSNFDPYGVTNKDAESLKHCEFETAKTYVLFGGVSPQKLATTPNEYFYTVSGNASPRWKCVPNALVTDETTNTLINRIKNIMKVKRDVELQK